MSILVTGFDPFDGASVNPSWEAVSLLPSTIAGHEVHRLQLPTIFGRCGDMLMQAAQEIQPSLVILCGVAQGREAVTPELVAVNYRMARIPDNAGQTFSGVKIDENSPAAYMTDTPVQEIIAAIQQAGIPARLSLSAGAYVCNDLYFAALKNGLPALFIHVPGSDVVDAAHAAQAIQIAMETALHKA